MCRLIWKEGTHLVWILTEEEVTSGPVIRVSTSDYHCGVRMAVTETHVQCRVPTCRFSVFRWRP